MMTERMLKLMAKKHGWEFHDIQHNISMISFVKEVGGDAARINVYMTKMTVSTAINHPKKGKTQLFRKRVGRNLMEQIFENPRVHTDKGYQRRGAGNG
jgi:hypothetical protein